MERRNFLKLSSAVTAGLALAPIDVIEGMAVVSTTAFFVFALEWRDDRVSCSETDCVSSSKVVHNHYKLNLNRYRIDAFDAEDAKAQVTALIPEGRTLGEPVKVADAYDGWIA